MTDSLIAADQRIAELEAREDSRMSDPLTTREVRTIENAARLTALMAADAALWADAKHIETAYVQQALRYLTLYIEGQWEFYRAYEALEEMQP